MKIAIVNDTAMTAEALRRIVASDPTLQLLWIARDGREAVDKCLAERPDLILMDLVMPVMDGVAATRAIMSQCPCGILVVTATVDGNASKVFEAMGCGALDAVDTPTLGVQGSPSSALLLAKIKTLGRLLGKSARASVGRIDAVPGAVPPLVAIGSSTGGPKALAEIFSRLPAEFPAAIVVAQHVDKQFAEGLATWLQEKSAMPVRLAKEGARPRAGEILIAATNDHIVARSQGVLAYTVDPVEYPFRPSVDEFFRTLGRHWPDRGVAVILTGMSRDGADGMLALRTLGWHTIAQDEATSVVYAMPKAAAQINAAVDILPIQAIGPALVARFTGRASRPRG